MGNKLGRLFFFAVIALTGACSSLSRQECAQSEWGRIGFEHGLKGYELSQGLEIVGSCREYGYQPDMALYNDNYAKGLARFCEPENGFELGLDGADYNGICRSEAFRKAYQDGHAMYEVKHRKQEIANRIADIDRRMREIRDTLRQEGISRNEREVLKDELRSLERERRELMRERAHLSLPHEALSY